MFEPYLFKPHSLLVLYGGVLADVVFGDRNHPWHPIRLMGAAISFCEKMSAASRLDPMVYGAGMSIGLTTFTFLGVFALSSFLRSVSLLLFLLFSCGCIYFGLCLRCLAGEAAKVLTPLGKGEMEIARKRLSMLVSRDTTDMDETAICRSLIETVSENFVDGVCSPFFYALLGGPAMCMAFKMVSTLDSMVGYQNKKYESLGKAAARMDDALNFIPARLSVFIISVAGLLVKGSPPSEVVRGAVRDARLHKSPNSGFPESAFAHVLGVSLGGPVVYQGALYRFSYINKEGRPPGLDDVRSSIKLLYVSAGVFYILPLLLVTFA